MYLRAEADFKIHDTKRQRLNEFGLAVLFLYMKIQIKANKYLGVHCGRWLLPPNSI